MRLAIVKVHPDGTGALKKNGPQSIGKSRGGWTTKIHMVPRMPAWRSASLRDRPTMRRRGGNC